MSNLVPRWSASVVLSGLQRGDLTLSAIPALQLQAQLSPFFVGAKGDKGDKGDTGATGATGTSDWNDLTNKPALSFRFDFTNQNVITINHNMQAYPSAYVEDSGGSQWIPNRVTYPSLNTVQVHFNTVFSGTVYLS